MFVWPLAQGDCDLEEAETSGHYVIQRIGHSKCHSLLLFFSGMSCKTPCVKESLFIVSLAGSVPLVAADTSQGREACMGEGQVCFTVGTASTEKETGAHVLGALV